MLNFFFLLSFHAVLQAAPLPLAYASLPRDSLAVPRVRQATEYSCGAAALLSVLQYWNVYEGAEMGIHSSLGTDPQLGTAPEPMLAFARSKGLLGEFREGLTIRDLRAVLKARKTAILMIQAWPDVMRIQGTSWKDRWDDGHYVVLIGMDAEQAYFMDPSLDRGYGTIPLSELPERWHDIDGVGTQARKLFHAAIILHGETGLREYPTALEPIR